MDWQDSARQIFSTCRPGARVAKIVIETDDAVHFGMREIQRAGDQRRGRGIDISELFLQCMQNGQQSAGKVLQLANPSLGPVRIPGLHVAHAE